VRALFEPCCADTGGHLHFFLPGGPDDVVYQRFSQEVLSLSLQLRVLEFGFRFLFRGPAFVKGFERLLPLSGWDWFPRRFVKANEPFERIALIDVEGARAPLQQS